MASNQSFLRRGAGRSNQELIGRGAGVSNEELIGRGAGVSNEEFIRRGPGISNEELIRRGAGTSNQEFIRRAVQEEVTMRFFSVYCDYATSARAGAVGTFQVIDLKEGDVDMTHVVDQGFHFHDLDELRAHLARALDVSAESIEIEEVEEADDV